MIEQIEYNDVEDIDIRDIEEGIEDIEEGIEDIEEYEDYENIKDHDEDSLIITFSGNRPDFIDHEESDREDSVDTETMETEKSETENEEVQTMSTGSESIRKYLSYLSSYPVIHTPRAYHPLVYHTYTYTYPTYNPAYFYSYFGWGRQTNKGTK